MRTKDPCPNEALEKRLKGFGGEHLTARPFVDARLRYLFAIHSLIETSKTNAV